MDTWIPQCRKLRLMFDGDGAIGVCKSLYTSSEEVEGMELLAMIFEVSRQKTGERDA